MEYAVLCSKDGIVDGRSQFEISNLKFKTKISDSRFHLQISILKSEIQVLETACGIGGIVSRLKA